MNLFGWGSTRRPAANMPQRPASAKAKASTEVDWSRVRTPLRPQDLVLSPMAQEWLASFRPEAQPSALCLSYPRIANRLALCWGDRGLAARVLDDLIMDKRRGRTGFPAEVTKDLLKLRMLRPMISRAMFDAPPSSPWDDVNMAAGDR